ncbi:MAG: NAD(P)/FAD-dependent oxidoreductase [Patescibacteria group bacterium]
MLNKEIIWDVIIVGGGAAGMMCAGTAGENDAKVLVIEKNKTLGKKLLITGGGRCNVTNSEFDTRKLLLKFKDNGKFLFSSFSQWAVKETLEFFHMKGMNTKVENELRTFPVSNSAQSVWDVLVENMKKNKVSVLSDSPVTEIIREDGKIVGVKTKNKVVYGKNIVIATGGTSRPETGSTGDAYKWLKDIGHKIIIPAPSLVPLVIKDTWIKKLAGVSLSDIKITVFQNDKKQDMKIGKMLFTHVGVSGPTILNMSKDIGELLKYGDVNISLDLLPKQDHGMIDKKLQEIFKVNDKKKFKNSLKELVPSAMAPVIVELSKIDPEKNCNSVTKEERKKLTHLLKDLRMQVDKLLGVEKAIITSGGVSLDEVDFKTMHSKIYPNLYFVGDILNIDRPTGGYSLQLCWTTGYVAGSWVSKN